MVKIFYLGQSGLLFKVGAKKIMFDPYLSDSAEKMNSKNYRRQPIDKRVLTIKPDILLFTHNHIDHYDEKTIRHYLTEDSNVLVFAPFSVWQEVKQLGGSNNYVLFNRGTTWTEGNLIFRAVKAEHSDRDAIGVLFSYKNINYYITGDTLYNEEVFNDITVPIDFIFLPINGVGNNMNVIDASKFVKRIGAKKVIPVHFGLFDDMTGKELKLPNVIIPKIYEEIKL